MTQSQYKPFKFKPIKIGGLKFKQVEYHRNGISGEGFYCAVANDIRYGDMLITYFPDESDACYCAVYKIELLPDITFGTNSWRGDEYVNAMKQAAEQYSKQYDEYLDNRLKEMEKE